MEEISGIYGTLCLKRNDVRLFFTIFVSLKTMAETKSEENLAVRKRALSTNREIGTRKPTGGALSSRMEDKALKTSGRIRNLELHGMRFLI